MFSVIFEVCPKAERFDEYLALAKRLKPLLEKVDGFVDNERFESKRRPGCDSFAFDVARRKVGRPLAHRGGAPLGPGARPLGDSAGLSLESWRRHRRYRCARGSANSRAAVRRNGDRSGEARNTDRDHAASGRLVRVTRRSALRSRPGCIVRRGGRARRVRQHLQSRQVRGAGLLGRRKGREPMDTRRAEGGANPAAPQGSDRA